MVMDRRTGEIKMQGHEGRLYTLEDVQRAERRAASGDAAALALLADVDFETPGAIDVMDMEAILHDCPECRAALARGEKPTMIAGAELEALWAEFLRSR
jgi:hypothetical protein